MNFRPKSEDPVELVLEPPRGVAKNGYRWVRGEWGHKKPLTDTFLIANPGGYRVVLAPPVDLYLELAQLETTAEATLAFATRFGPLELHQKHFHSTECSATFGESSLDWMSEITEFQFWFEVWRAAEDRDLNVARKMLTQAGVPFDDPGIGPALKKDIARTAKEYVIDKINSYLVAWTAGPRRRGCFKATCSLNKKDYRISFPKYVSYKLRLVETGSGAKGKGYLSSNSLLVTAWLQFADVVCGQTKYRPCEECGRLMDVSDSARPGSKRMHDRCSLAGRMRRYRAKTRERDSSDLEKKGSS